ncbi:flavin-containing monooxygenase [Pseudofrankia inefficax]|uniref:Flavin-containing monooxygenase-like protein n=1 Tax=Pseudofrankia inefficax (strain DSM 45817 / CECT 9037 / DDB 130130 / EuI1c) TaxID=298654 RepID=E3IWH1_PSEI1|nr:NAD(P)/FAD-dependent oxidoreductase [Pseudofrankia inefficax]ADP80154.1 Flavin-containing monooxygenase-like protein [Pseudofrankia inefficax]
MQLAGDAVAPFTDDRAAIEAVLLDVHPPSLLLSLVHLTGDLELLTGRFRPKESGLRVVNGGMADEDLRALRALAADVLVAHRERGYRLPPPPTTAQLLQMMEAQVCGPVGAEYTDLLVGELHIDGSDPGEAPLRSSAQARAELPVVIVGCGESGLLAGIRLREASIPFIIVEKRDGVGGTWRANRYPGCRVDIPNHFYSYSFEASDHWSEYFAQQPELLVYFQSVLDHHGIEPHVRWNTEVTGARWQEATGRWEVTVRGAGSSEPEILQARALITAVGQLSRPSVPSIPGAESFAGPSFHTADWPDDVDLTGARVAVVGAGASGFQLVPTVADRVAALTVYQRTAQWMAPNPTYHDAVSPGARWAIRHVPFYARWYRLGLMWAIADTTAVASRIDPDWDGGNRSISAVNNLARQVLTDWLTEQVRDPDLLSKVIPDYPPFGKRTLQDNGSWLRALQRDNVELVRDRIERIEPGAVVTADGIRREADVLIWATGFRVSEILSPIRVEGRDGRTLEEVWDGRPAAHLGMTVPGFPNFFMIYGPGSNAVSGGSVIFTSECQVRYIVGCLDLLADAPGCAIEVRGEVHDDYQARTQAELDTLVWSHPAVRSYYKSADGRIYTVLPWRSIDYWHWTRQPDPSDFLLEPTRQAVPSVKSGGS